jgi:hypothetical protein
MSKEETIMARTSWVSMQFKCTALRTANNGQVP